MPKLFQHTCFTALATTVLLCLTSTCLLAASGPPTGKFYVVDVIGTARLHTLDDGPILNLAARSVYKAEGVMIETGPASKVVLLFSNGTSLSCTEEVRLRVLKFSQETVTAPLTDLNKEPSVSKVIFMLEKGKVGIASPELAAGSSQLIITPQGQVNMRNSQMMVDVHSLETTISVIAGEVTVRSSGLDGGSVLKPGTQAIFGSTMTQQLMPVRLESIAAAQLALITAVVEESEMARHIVTFAPTPRTGSARAGGSGTQAQGEGTQSIESLNDTANEPAQDLQPVRLVPVSLPVHYTISPARING